MVKILEVSKRRRLQVEVETLRGEEWVVVASHRRRRGEKSWRVRRLLVLRVEKAGELAGLIQEAVQRVALEEEIRA